MQSKRETHPVDKQEGLYNQVVQNKSPVFFSIVRYEWSFWMVEPRLHRLSSPRPEMLRPPSLPSCWQFLTYWTDDYYLFVPPSFPSLASALSLIYLSPPQRSAPHVRAG